jgi:hypothetical protein
MSAQKQSDLATSIAAIFFALAHGLSQFFLTFLGLIYISLPVFETLL